jgi:hypothetical protein
VLQRHGAWQVDVRSNATVARWQRKGLSPGEPIFVPRSPTQDALSDDGAIIVHALNEKGQLFGVVLDARTLAELAVLQLPVPLMPNVGLHCLWHPNLTATLTPTMTGEATSSNGKISSGAMPLPLLFLVAALSLAALCLNCGR